MLPLLMLLLFLSKREAVARVVAFILLRASRNRQVSLQEYQGRRPRPFGFCRSPLSRPPCFCAVRCSFRASVRWLSAPRARLRCAGGGQNLL